MNQDKLEKIFKVKVRPELDEYGTRLKESDIENHINELPVKMKIAGLEYILSTEEREELISLTKSKYNLQDVDHIYIRKNGIYNDGEEIKLDKENWHFYHRHRHFLEDNVFKNKIQIVHSLDYETDQIIKKFPRPKDHDSFSKKGLVIGHVQSGKTANFTHLISKAASIGYRFVIVLAGMTDTLRMQTQFRLDKELVGVNSAAIEGLETIKWNRGEVKFKAITQLPDKKVKIDNGDFRPPVYNFSDHFDTTNDVTVAVVKKLARNGNEGFDSVLGSLIRWINHPNDKETIKSVPVLIIDDEADQASIDGSDEDSDPTVINLAVRKLLSLFPKSVYVGYTATPFANVFINPTNEHSELSDLYPKDFIYSLPEPEEYFGSNKFFGVKGKHDKPALIEYLKLHERKVINDEEQDITFELERAIDSFIYSVIVRKYRGNDKYCGMMIHTDHRNIYHNTVYSKVREYLFKLECSATKFDSFKEYLIKSRSNGKLLAVFNDYPDFSYTEFEAEFYFVLDYLRKIEDGKTSNIRVINSRNDKLDYLNEELKYLICIGGNIMSRGVTVEGLTVTYYLRDTLKYDTLLQMGRWFGYRMGYEDLLRLYTTERIADNFEFVMGVENDLRNEIGRYVEEGLTPLDFAPKVRAHRRMYPTAKMGNSSLTKSYSQQVVQTIYFSRDMEVLTHNYKLTEDLINQNLSKFSEGEEVKHKYFASKIEMNYLIDYLKQYKFSAHNSFKVQDILDYIGRRVKVGELKDFNVILSGLKKVYQESEKTEIGGMCINPAGRNLRRVKGDEYKNENIVNIGVISDTKDIEIASESGKLNLILYFIDRKRSNSFNVSEENYSSEDLNFNPVGFAISFPKTSIANGEKNYYQQIFE